MRRRRRMPPICGMSDCAGKGLMAVYPQGNWAAIARLWLELVLPLQPSLVAKVRSNTTGFCMRVGSVPTQHQEDTKLHVSLEGAIWTPIQSS